jgi:hypothetical protein
MAATAYSTASQQLAAVVVGLLLQQQTPFLLALPVDLEAAAGVKMAHLLPVAQLRRQAKEMMVEAAAVRRTTPVAVAVARALSEVTDRPLVPELPVSAVQDSLSITTAHELLRWAVKEGA